MFLLFDLDDTLIETSLCLTPVALKKAYDVLSVEAPFDELLEINRRSFSSQIALECFCTKYQLEPRALVAAKKALLAPLGKDQQIDPVEGAIELLDQLNGRHQLALVTIGDPNYQMEKMEKAGIQPDRFSKIAFGTKKGKKPIYQDLVSGHGVSPENVCVCGDRVSMDLSPGKELGFFTVHFRHGRGLFCTEPRNHVDLSIDALTQFHEVFAKHEV